MTKFDPSAFVAVRDRARLGREGVSKALKVTPRQVRRYEKGESRPDELKMSVLRQLAEEPAPYLHKPAFRFIDLFAGIGGLRRGFEPLGGQCVFTSEWDKYAEKTYRANHPQDAGTEHIFAGDITAYTTSEEKLREIPKHDLLLAGFPCQPFSIAGVSKKNALNRPHGFLDETQGTLFFHVAKIIAEHRPRAFVLENVKNLLNHDKGRTFQTIMKVLKEDLKYTNTQVRVFSGKSFVPQHRERIFIVGFREDNGFDFESLMVPDPLKGPRLGSILHPENGATIPDGHFIDAKTGDVSSRYVLTDHLWKYLQDYAAKHKAAGNGFGFGLVGPDDVTRTLSARYYKDGSEILVQRKKGNPRRLTPRECARLMGFDEPQGSEFKIVVSDTQAYKQFGNSVVVPVVKAVANHMAPWLCETTERVPAAQKELRLVG